MRKTVKKMLVKFVTGNDSEMTPHTGAPL